MVKNIKQRMKQLYFMYCLAVLVGIVFSMCLVFYWSTVSGDYTPLFTTNVVGEHWIEVALLLTSIPGIASIVYKAIPQMKEVTPQ